MFEALIVASLNAEIIATSGTIDDKKTELVAEM